MLKRLNIWELSHNTRLISLLKKYIFHIIIVEKWVENLKLKYQLRLFISNFSLPQMEMKFNTPASTSTSRNSKIYLFGNTSFQQLGTYVCLMMVCYTKEKNKLGKNEKRLNFPALSKLQLKPGSDAGAEQPLSKKASCTNHSLWRVNF